LAAERRGFLSGGDLFLKQEDTRLEEGPVPVDEGGENVSATGKRQAAL